MKLLIIDEDAGDRSLTKKLLLSKFADADIIEVGNQKTFEETISAFNFDLVITEYRLGWTNGISLLKTIWARACCVPVIMLTDAGNEDIAATAIKCGMADYIAKRNRHSLPNAIEQCLINSAIKSRYENKQALLPEKTDLALSRLASDFAYSMHISPEGKPTFEWITEPFIRILGINSHVNRKLQQQVDDWGLPIHPDDICIVQQRFEKLLKGFEDVSEYRVITNEGEILYLSDHALPIRDWSSGRVVRIYGAIQDISGRRTAEENLYLIQHAIDSSNNGIIITGLANTDYAIIYVNEAFLRMTGYTREELIGHNCRILQDHDRGQPAINELRAALQSNKEAYAVLRNYRKDGSLFWNEIYIAPIRNKHDQITHYVGVQNDVTHRIEMADLLSKSETKWRSIFNNAFDGIIIIDAKGKIRSINPSVERLFGYSPEELIGCTIAKLLPENERRLKNSQLSTYLESGKSKTFGFGRTVNGRKKDGSIFPMEFSFTEFNAYDQQHFIGMVHDITERKEAEHALRNLSRHLQTVREDERTRIAREIHDELGSVLTALKIDLSWLNNQLPAELSHCVEKVSVMSRHLDDGIQTIRKIIADLRPDILDHFGLIAAIEWKLDEFRQQTGIQCLLTVPKKNTLINEERDIAVFRILQEALTNIAKHSKATKVTLEVETQANNLTMKITDNGCGMAEAQMHVPGKFGILGMHERARHFGGEVKISSHPQKGTTLTLKMPLKPLARDHYD